MTQQLTPDEVTRLYDAGNYDAIDAARRAGRLDAVLGVDPQDIAVLDRARSDQPLTAADVTALHRLRRPDLIETARQEGRLATLLDPTTEETHR